MTKIDWDDAFANMAHVSGSEKLPSFWANRAKDYRDSAVSLETDIPYGDHERERFDLVIPDGKPNGLIVFVHGGFWIRLDKSYWTDLAEGARANGWAVCLPSYTLAPDASLTHMTQQISRAIVTAGTLIEGPIRLIGHSAGGHLVTRQICTDTRLSDALSMRIEKCISLSGLHDLRPLMHTKMNELLKLDLERARSESTALREPLAGKKVGIWVGGSERPEFIRQAKLLDIMWSALEADTHLTIESEHNHFTILEALKEKDSALTKALVL